MIPKKVIVAVSLDKKDRIPLEKLKETPWLENAEVHIVNVVEIISTGIDISSLVIPPPSEYPKIRKEVERELAKIGRKLFPHTGRPKVVCKCLLETDAKQAVCEYAKRQKADLVIVATRGKKGIKGFFDSSFARYLSKYSPADLLTLRPGK